MHGHVNEAEFLLRMSTFLGSYYIFLALMNGVMALYLWTQLNRVGEAMIWTLVGVFYMIIAPLAMSGSPELMAWVSVPAPVRDFLNPLLANATIYTLGSLAILTVLFIFREVFVQPIVAWGMLNIAALAMGLSMTNPFFADIVTKPDNVPIVGLVFLLGFFTWLATSIAVENDARAKIGLPPLEKLDDEKVLVWPDLVYTELICMVALTAVMIVWALALQAPLEEPASAVKTPNPSKAPWYFLGLQEMLVYYDPWMAGVVLPSLVIVGLMAIPFIDFNKKGNGYYTIEERPFAYLTFQFGFLVLWVTLIILGTFLRGPNWNLFGPFEPWDSHKVEVLNNVDLSQYFWIYGLGQALPRAPEGADGLTQFWFILWRELPGILALAFYFLLLPPLMAMTVLRSFFVRMGFIRFMVMANLLLFMAALPIKMLLRWTVNLKYIVAIPEYFLNF
jgi:hypothetical protein